MSKPSSNTASMDINSLGIGRRGGPRAEDNTADRFELFLLGDGEKKVTEEADTRESTLDSCKSPRFCSYDGVFIGVMLYTANV